jgi:prepilin-type N-terminal cleavage/methylation domain-containing protein
MNSSQEGFTVIEMLVTVIVSAIFAFMFYQLFINSSKLNSVARRDALASEIAYSNLKKYPTAASVGGVANCASPDASTTTTATNIYPDIGQVSETIIISWPFACTNPDIAKIESSVTYKGNSNKVSYVAYVN